MVHPADLIRENLPDDAEDFGETICWLSRVRQPCLSSKPIVHQMSSGVVLFDELAGLEGSSFRAWQV